MKVKKKDIAPFLSATFPEYSGRKFSVEARAHIYLCGLNWDGGSRNQYRACTVTGEPIGSADRFNHVAPWNNQAEGQKVPLPEGCVVAEHTIFQGKDMGVRFYLNPSDMPKVLSE